MTLTPVQYELVTTAMAMTLAGMIGATIFFLAMRQSVAPVYQRAIVIAAVVTAIAGFHYFRVLSSWSDAFAFSDGAFQPTGIPFFNSFRYADWLITVPLLLVQLVIVLALDKKSAKSLLTKLIIAATVMIAVGYPGEVANTTSARVVWGLAGMVPFFYIVFVLWGELGQSLLRQPREVGRLVSYARLVVVGTWVVYPIAYFIPTIGFDAATAEVLRQTVYSVADLAAKVGYGLLIYRIARLKSEIDRDGGSNGEQPAETATRVVPPSMPLRDRVPAAKAR